jgi:hypothetical protein
MTNVSNIGGAGADTARELERDVMAALKENYELRIEERRSQLRKEGKNRLLGFRLKGEKN